MQVDMILARRRAGPAGGRLLASRGSGLPRELHPLTAQHPGVIPRRGQPALAELQHGGRRPRLQKTQRRNGERVHVPHHMAEIIVVVPPGREAVDRGRRRRSVVDGTVQIEDGRIGHRLPSGLRAEQPDPSLPQLAPGLAIAAAQFVEAELPRDGDHAHGVPVRLAVHHRRHEAGQGLEAEPPSLLRPLRIGGRQGTERVPRLLRPLRLVRHGRGHGQTQARQSAFRLPEDRAVADGLGLPGRVEAPLDHPASQVVGVEP